jgi:hypothetical protein
MNLHLKKGVLHLKRSFVGNELEYFSCIEGLTSAASCRASIHSHFMEVKASYGMGFKSAQAWKEGGAHAP